MRWKGVRVEEDGDTGEWGMGKEGGRWKVERGSRGWKMEGGKKCRGRRVEDGVREVEES